MLKTSTYPLHMSEKSKNFDISHKLSPVHWPDVNDDSWEGYTEISIETSVSFHDEYPYASHKAALSNGVILYPERAIQQSSIDPFSLFDSINAEVFSFYADCKLQSLFDYIIPSKVVAIAEIGVKPQFRGLDLGLSILKSWVANLSSPAENTLFLIFPGSINKPSGKCHSWFNLGKPSHKRRFSQPADVLARYWLKAGFKNWPGTPHMFYATGALKKLIIQLHKTCKS